MAANSHLVTNVCWLQSPLENVNSALGRYHKMQSQGYMWTRQVTKWPEIFPMRTTTTLATNNKFQEVFSRFGYSEKLVSDNGTQLTSSKFADFCLNFDVLKPPKEEVASSNQKMESHYSRKWAAKWRHFVIGQSVLVKDYHGNRVSCRRGKTTRLNASPPNILVEHLERDRGRTSETQVVEQLAEASVHQKSQSSTAFFRLQMTRLYTSVFDKSADSHVHWLSGLAKRIRLSSGYPDSGSRY
ncbi:hypothetical protein CSKR_107829 [Clonorchis sinensis]|uniref:Uncharacterized protein n=1 Tax=Clonorchis sinensis TaxID=79923 RepID=A0A419PIH2_CLOSI|nr:hypothetical protein CSKR_107829 [Clonorchis sinensis]